ncbi:hypothetical protein ACFLTD_05540, partial [Elusimicrobiota bacterium]
YYERLRGEKQLSFEEIFTKELAIPSFFRKPEFKKRLVAKTLEVYIKRQMEERGLKRRTVVDKLFDFMLTWRKRSQGSAFAYRLNEPFDNGDELILPLKLGDEVVSIGVKKDDKLRVVSAGEAEKVFERNILDDARIRLADLLEKEESAPVPFDVSEEGRIRLFAAFASPSQKPLVHIELSLGQVLDESKLKEWIHIMAEESELLNTEKGYYVLNPASAVKIILNSDVFPTFRRDLADNAQYITDYAAGLIDNSDKRINLLEGMVYGTPEMGAKPGAKQVMQYSEPKRLHKVYNIIRNKETGVAEPGEDQVPEGPDISEERVSLFSKYRNIVIASGIIVISAVISLPMFISGMIAAPAAILIAGISGGLYFIRRHIVREKVSAEDRVPDKIAAAEPVSDIDTLFNKYLGEDFRGLLDLPNLPLHMHTEGPAMRHHMQEMLDRLNNIADYDWIPSYYRNIISSRENREFFELFILLHDIGKVDTAPMKVPDGSFEVYPAHEDASIKMIREVGRLRTLLDEKLKIAKQEISTKQLITKAEEEFMADPSRDVTDEEVEAARAIEEDLAIRYSGELPGRQFFEEVVRLHGFVYSLNEGKISEDDVKGLFDTINPSPDKYRILDMIIAADFLDTVDIHRQKVIDFAKSNIEFKQSRMTTPDEKQALLDMFKGKPDPEDEIPIHFSLYIWKEFRLAIEEARNKGELSDASYNLIVNSGLGVSRTDGYGERNLQKDAIPILTRTINSSRTSRGEPELSEKDVIRYVSFHERAHQLIKITEKYREDMFVIARNLVQEKFYDDPEMKELGISGFDDLLDYFTNNYGKEYRDNPSAFIEELIVMTLTDTTIPIFGKPVKPLLRDK